MAARRRREPMGWRPERRSWRSSEGVKMVFGSRFGSGGVDVDGVGRASSCRWLLVVKLEGEDRVPGCRLAAFRRQCSAGRMV